MTSLSKRNYLFWSPSKSHHIFIFYKSDPGTKSELLGHTVFLLEIQRHKPKMKAL